MRLIWKSWRAQPGPCMLPHEKTTKMVFLFVEVLFFFHIFSGCTTKTRGMSGHKKQEAAGGYNPNTGNAWKAQKNQNGVTTTTTSKGGEAKTKNGKGVYKSPSGQTCYRTANGQGCN